MVDQEIVKIANDRIRLEIEEQNNRLLSEIGKIKAEMSHRGALHSSGTITRVSGLCIDTIRNRVQLIWQTFFRFLTTAGISHTPKLADELKDLVAQLVPEKLEDLTNHITQTAKMAGSPSLGDRLLQDLDKGRIKAFAKVGTEIDLFVHSLRKRADTLKEGGSSTVFNIYSPVGSIQTGDNSIANITQKIDTEVKEQIRKVLDEIESKLVGSEVETPTPKSELI